MTQTSFMLAAFLISIVAGFLGSILGLGGGIIIVPALTLLLGVDIRFAIGASIVSVIATSIGAAVHYVRNSLCNIRVAMLLESATTSGAIAGSMIGGALAGPHLYVIFAAVLGLVAIVMLRRPPETENECTGDYLGDCLRLHSSFHDDATNLDVSYRTRGTVPGLALSAVAGAVSGLLGIGGGALKVPAMNLLMGIPIKVASATSNFTIGVTAAASAGIYFSRGEVAPLIAGPVALGVVTGAMLGSRVLGRIRNRWIKIAFTFVLLIISVQMLWKGLH